MDDIKLSCAIQLFANEKSHILLLGDPGTGKTDIIRSASELHPISSFGLGSGTSGAGLGIAFRGDEMIKGLLPLANKGLCCIDELNLLKNEDRASLYNAMEKGFITYDKASKHIQVEADVSILATANPKGDKFVGWVVETLKKQLPFDSALLSRFHLIFLIRKPDIKEFLEITKHIIRGDKKKEIEANKKFVKEYVEYARSLEVEVPKVFEKNIGEFIKELKKNESKYLIEVSPRLVVGFIRFAKASARMDLRRYVTSIDLERVKKIFLSSLQIKKVDVVEETSPSKTDIENVVEE
jgi:replicative DNA helicase Mcm